MTDEELIARLRQHDGWVTLEAHTHLTAADRIKALTKERDALIEWSGQASVRAERAEDLAERLEAKLAKAVEALGRIARQPDYRLPSPQGIAQEALAELKGESHD